jgi:acyl-CoA thioester hydrolase
MKLVPRAPNRLNEFESGKMTPQDPTKAQELAALQIYDVTLRDEWIDRNDHMNNSFYLVASQQACLGALRLWRGDFTEGERAPFGNFVTQALVTYIREVRSGIRLSIRCRLVSCDDKRSHVYAEMLDGKTSKLFATVERTSINVLRGHPPKVVPYPDVVQANLKAAQERHAVVPFLEQRSPLLQLKQNRICVKS